MNTRDEIQLNKEQFSDMEKEALLFTQDEIVDILNLHTTLDGESYRCYFKKDGEIQSTKLII